MVLINELERKLDSFEAEQRKRALKELCENARTGGIKLPETGSYINLHCHTFFSYNSYGYSPSKLAWLSRKEGLAAAGIVDFDVLDGLEEFIEAGKMVGLKVCVGLESRVFVPEFADKVINSPGEPGICYFMGIGFPKAELQPQQQEFLANLSGTSRERNVNLVNRVNEYFRDVHLDYEKDVLTLTPSGNATERHICLAYARKAKQIFGDGRKLVDFWSEKLGVDISSLELPEGQELLNTIRGKTMKKGGVGYVQPDAGDFPKLEQTSRFILAAGGIPALTWLDGTSEGEKQIDKLLDLFVDCGLGVVNTIPNRNFSSDVQDEKLQNLYRFVEKAERRNLPVVAGTEMNIPGQKFVNSFESSELAPLVPIFLKGAYIVYAHSVLQRQAGLGYTSKWSEANFDSVAAKNEFFYELGSILEADREDTLASLNPDADPDDILDKLRSK